MSVFRPGDALDALRLVERDPVRYERVRVVVIDPGATVPAGAIPDGYACVVYLTPEQAQELQDRTRGGGSAADDEP
jgi:hypothetical protein